MVNKGTIEADLALMPQRRVVLHPDRTHLCSFELRNLPQHLPHYYSPELRVSLSLECSTSSPHSPAAPMHKFVRMQFLLN